MNNFQRELKRRIGTKGFTKQEYKQIDKKMYPLLTRINMCKKYNPVFYYVSYGLWIVLVSILSSLLTVKILMR